MRNAPLQSTAHTPAEQRIPAAEAAIPDTVPFRTQVSIGGITFGAEIIHFGDDDTERAIVHAGLADCAELDDAGMADLIAQTERFLVDLRIMRALHASRGGAQ